MADTIFWLTILTIGGILWTLSKGNLNFPIGGGRRDATLRREFGMLDAIKPTLIHTPNGYGRPSGYRANNAGGVDIILLDGSIIPNVNPDIDLPVMYGSRLLDLALGNGTIQCNVCINTGERVSWREFHGGVDAKAQDRMTPLIDRMDIAASNLANFRIGSDMAGTPGWDKTIDSLTKTFGKSNKNLSLRDAPISELTVRRQSMLGDDIENERGGLL
jgi:hypothetical protein